MPKPDRRRKLWVVEYKDSRGRWHATYVVARTRDFLRLSFGSRPNYQFTCYTPRDETDY